MKTRVKIAAATLLTLTALTGAGILVHQGVTGAQENGQSVTSPARTVFMADPAAPEPCPYPYPMAVCAPIPPKPLEVVVPDEPMEGVAEAYAAAWAEIEVTR